MYQRHGNAGAPAARAAVIVLHVTHAQLLVSAALSELQQPLQDCLRARVPSKGLSSRDARSCADRSKVLYGRRQFNCQ
jgi:hypothetical protein